MHPAFSIIFFTTASGAGYGLLVALGLLVPLGLLPQGSGFGFVALAVGLGLVTAGLLSSMLHLGRPERAWRALSQWRSSWLSREGVLSLLTYAPAAVFGIAWVFFGEPGGVAGLFGWLMAVMALVTVYCTAMIYASLKTIRQWHNPYVPPNYMLLSLASGLLLANTLAALFGGGRGWLLVLGALALAVAWAAKEAYWRAVGTAGPATTPESATGLGRLGRVRMLEAPHSEENYLLKEMGFRAGREHAERLRMIARGAGFAAPLVLTLLAWLTGGVVAAVLLVVAVLAAAAGLIAERWLFFAEAKHTVINYYGGARAA